MDKRIHIVVSNEDINKGQAHPMMCPIARATKKLFPDKCVMVGEMKMRIGEKLYALPLIARAFIKEFDSNYPGKDKLKPPSFYIEEIT